ncbi:hypothetical protein [Undibacterium squillarum]|uniref:Uncharacterized protein n=1 Tax=Undibacterium squillarum TaxID=1131567 RepID=A0ABQ2XYX7_9BURK|nr:hypothetical protein [Undibacterium squillarum]GGX44477.1 hypothetical protein GCM10010946_23800 [Undibacterium squillarum]
MKKMLKLAVAGLVLCSGASVMAEGVDTSVDGIFNALTSSTNLQATVDTLVSGGANPQSIISVAAAAGISLDAVKELQVCKSTSSGDNSLGASCLRPSSVVAAYQSGANDPVRFLPATAAGKKKAAESK